MIYILYLFIILILGFLLQLSSNRNEERRVNATIYIGIVYFIGWLIMGFRGEHVGKDTISYLEMYNQFKTLDFQSLIYKADIEPGWGILVGINHFFGGNFLTFQLILSGILCVLAGNFTIKVSFIQPGYHILTITIITFFYLYLISLNISRQITAVLFLANGLLYYNEKKYLKTLLYILCGISFHYSSLLGLSLFILWKFKNWKYIYITSLFGLVIIFFGIKILTNFFLSAGLYVNYLSSGASTFQEAGLARIMWIVIAFFSIIIIMNPKSFNNSIRITALYAIIYVFFNVISSEVSYIERLGLYFLPFVCIPFIAIGNYIKCQYLRIGYFSGLLGLYSLWFLLSARSDQYVYQISSLL
ncbi:MAG: EpsG family protein [Bacteroidales bacterium]|nr:EpsG family protein [Bacteroidales bacterium]